MLPFLASSPSSDMANGLDTLPVNHTTVQEGIVDFLPLRVVSVILVQLLSAMRLNKSNCLDSAITQRLHTRSKPACAHPDRRRNIEATKGHWGHWGRAATGAVFHDAATQETLEITIPAPIQLLNQNRPWWLKVNGLRIIRLAIPLLRAMKRFGSAMLKAPLSSNALQPLG
jgi:hypothetical protein